MKNKKMSIRISEENLAAIHRKAEQADMTFTDYVTKACLGKQIVVIDGLDDVLRQQKASGATSISSQCFAIWVESAWQALRK